MSLVICSMDSNLLILALKMTAPETNYCFAQSLLVQWIQRYNHQNHQELRVDSNH